MDKSAMITALLNVHVTGAAAQEVRRYRLQRMTAAGLKREMLMRGLAEYDDSDAEDAEDDYTFPAGLFALAPDPRYAE